MRITRAFLACSSYETSQIHSRGHNRAVLAYDIRGAGRLLEIDGCGLIPLARCHSGRERRHGDPHFSSERTLVFSGGVSMRDKEEFQLTRAPIEVRSRAGLTQGEVAKRMQTTQAVIARLESGGSRPSTRTLERYAKATGSRLRITFEPERTRP